MFKRTETTTLNDEQEIIVSLDDKDYGNVNEPNYTVVFEKVTKDDVTLDQLIDAIENEFENANYHSVYYLPGTIIEHVVSVVGEDVAKTIVFNLVEDKGFLLGL